MGQTGTNGRLIRISGPDLPDHESPTVLRLTRARTESRVKGAQGSTVATMSTTFIHYMPPSSLPSDYSILSRYNAHRGPPNAAHDQLDEPTAQVDEDGK